MKISCCDYGGLKKFSGGVTSGENIEYTVEMPLSVRLPEPILP